MKAKNIRVELDSREEKLSYKLRESSINKIPYTLIIGDKEIENNTISYRCLGSNETINMKVEEFVEYILDVINNKK